MTKILNGRDLADFIKEKQARQVRQLLKTPKLLIIRDSDNPVIMKYVGLKKQYGADIGVEVEDFNAAENTSVKGLTKLFTDKNNRGVKSLTKPFTETEQNPIKEAISAKIANANSDPSVNGIIVQLPLNFVPKEELDELLKQISIEKDVDGLTGQADTATAIAINWLLAGHNIDLKGQKIAMVGRGRLVGAPLIRMWKSSGYDLTVFGHDGDLTQLKNFDIIVTATGVPRLIKTEMVKPGAAIVDAGTASENGVIVGDLDEAVRARTDLKAITPKFGGVGPLTVCALFDGVISRL